MTRGRQGDSIETLKLAFVSDLLSTNPECIEISEYIERAKSLFEEGDSQQGMLLLDNFIHDCRLLISLREPATERPGEVGYDIIGLLTRDTESFIFGISFVTLFVGSLIGIMIFKYKRL